MVYRVCVRWIWYNSDDGDETSSVDHVSDPGADGYGGNSGASHTVSLSVKSWNCPEYRQDEEGLWPFMGSNLQKLGAQAFPKSLPLSTDSPRVQLLINADLDQDVLADTSWDGKEDVPDRAIAAIKTDVAVAGDKRIGREAVITVLDGNTLTVDGSLVVDGSLIVDGTIIVDGTNGSFTFTLLLL